VFAADRIKNRKGITLIELLISIALIIAISLISTSFFNRFFAENSAANLTDQIIMSARKAQMYSMMSKENSTWGISYSTTTKKIYMFKGASFSSRTTSFDEVFDVPGSVVISGFKETIFSETKGLPNVTSTIILSKNNTTTSIVINLQGIISVQ
jgi:Tfp pilus assembly protein FimT